MIIINVSYRDRKIEREIQSLVGPPLGLWKRLKMKGNGSQRFEMYMADDAILEKIGDSLRAKHCNIELRKAGLLLYFRSRTENYALVIPFFMLVIFKSGNVLSLYAGKHNVKLKPSGGTLDRKFYRKILDLKIEGACTVC